MVPTTVDRRNPVHSCSRFPWASWALEPSWPPSPALRVCVSWERGRTGRFGFSRGCHLLFRFSGTLCRLHFRKRLREVGLVRRARQHQPDQVTPGKIGEVQFFERFAALSGCLHETHAPYQKIVRRRRADVRGEIRVEGFFARFTSHV